MPAWSDLELEDALAGLAGASDLGAACRAVQRAARNLPPEVFDDPLGRLTAIVAELGATPGSDATTPPHLRAAAIDAGRRLAALAWTDEEAPAAPAPCALVTLVGTGLWRRAVLEQVYDTLAARPAWAPTHWGYAEDPDREIAERDEVTGFAEDEPQEHGLTLGRGDARVPYRGWLDLGLRSNLELRIPAPRPDETQAAFELLFELRRATGADFGWASVLTGHEASRSAGAPRDALFREAHMTASMSTYWTHGPGGLAERTWIGRAYLDRIDATVVATFEGDVHRFAEGVGLDLAPAPWTLRGPRREHLWRRRMAHLRASEVFAIVRETAIGGVEFEAAPASRPPPT